MCIKWPESGNLQQKQKQRKKEVSLRFKDDRQVTQEEEMS